MKSILLAVVPSLLVILSCTAIQQQKALPPAPDTAEFSNLQVLPPNITHDQLIATMRGFTAALGVRCDHCHERVPGGGERDFLFPSDAKPEKEIARTMLRMTRAINQEYMTEVNAVSPPTVTCMTCHRGHSIPRVDPPEAAGNS